MNSILYKENESLILSFTSSILEALNLSFVKEIKHNSITPRIIGDSTENFIKKFFSNNLPA